MSKVVTVTWSTDYVERIARDVIAKCDAPGGLEADGLFLDIDNAHALAAFALDAIRDLAKPAPTADKGTRDEAIELLYRILNPNDPMQFSRDFAEAIDRLCGGAQ